MRRSLLVAAVIVAGLLAGCSSDPDPADVGALASARASATAGTPSSAGPTGGAARSGAVSPATPAGAPTVTATPAAPHPSLAPASACRTGPATAGARPGDLDGRYAVDAQLVASYDGRSEPVDVPPYADIAWDVSRERWSVRGHDSTKGFDLVLDGLAGAALGALRHGKVTFTYAAARQVSYEFPVASALPFTSLRPGATCTRRTVAGDYLLTSTRPAQPVFVVAFRPVDPGQQSGGLFGELRLELPAARGGDIRVHVRLEFSGGYTLSGPVRLTRA